MRTTAVATVARTPGSASVADPRADSEERARSSSDLPVERTRLSARATEICPTGIVSRFAHAASVYGRNRGGVSGQYPRVAASKLCGAW